MNQALSYPHARHDCVGCQERDADVEVLDDEGRSRRPAHELCQGCLGKMLAMQVLLTENSLTVRLRPAGARRG